MSCYLAVCRQLVYRQGGFCILPFKSLGLVSLHALKTAVRSGASDEGLEVVARSGGGGDSEQDLEVVGGSGRSCKQGLEVMEEVEVLVREVLVVRDVGRLKLDLLGRPQND
jgi:hypothetical protein